MRASVRMGESLGHPVRDPTGLNSLLRSDGNVATIRSHGIACEAAFGLQLVIKVLRVAARLQAP